jgi:PAS domain S-box-containing protein
MPGAETPPPASASHPSRADFPERKQPEREVLELSRRLAEQTAFLDTTLSHINDFAYIFDRDGRFVFVNQALLNLWGLKLEEAVGKNFFELKYPAELATRLHQEIQQVVDTGKGITNQTPYTSTSGHEGYYEYIFRPVPAPDGSIKLVAGSTRDITEHKRTEQALRESQEQYRKLAEAAARANQAKDDFLAALSHELRTPLSPVLLIATEGAANPDLPPAVRADFQVIARNVTLETQLINDLLDLTRITHGKTALSAEAIDLHAAVREALDTVMGDIREKALQLTLDLAAPAATVQGDSVRLQQVFWNIIRNAAKFTPEGGQVTIRSAVDAARGEVSVRIDDSGIGMTPAEIGRVFNAFEQGDHAGKAGSHRFGGLGLGLAISRMLVELHSGRLEAASAGAGQGSSFTVTLPLAAEATGRAPAGAAGTPLAASPARPLRILLVEDHEPTRVALLQLLRRRHHDVTAAGSLAQARALFSEPAFGLLISDIGLPDGDGYMLMSEMRARFGTRGIALTGYGMEDDIARCRAAGFVAHLIKPIRVQTLDEALAVVSAPKPGA